MKYLHLKHDSYSRPMIIEFLDNGSCGKRIVTPFKHDEHLNTYTCSPLSTFIEWYTKQAPEMYP